MKYEYKLLYPIYDETLWRTEKLYMKSGIEEKKLFHFLEIEFNKNFEVFKKKNKKNKFYKNNNNFLAYKSI